MFKIFLLNFISERYYKVLYYLFCFAPFCPPPSSYSLATPLIRTRILVLVYCTRNTIRILVCTFNKLVKQILLQ